MALLWIAAVVLGLIAYMVYDAFRKKTYWPDKGIPTVPGLPLVGSLFLQGVVKPGGETFEVKWTKKLGRIFGYFDGPRPVVMISDLDMLKNIMVKDFSHFANRRDFGIPGPIMEQNVENLRDQHWKNMRSVLTPAFASSKLKQMNPTIKECSDDLLRKMDEYADSGADCPVKDLYGQLTMDVIATAFFGTRINSQDNPNSGFVQHAKSIFDLAQFELTLLATMIFPNIGRSILRALKFQTVPKAAVDFFVKSTKEIVKMRLDSKQVRKDFLQLMLNSLKSQNPSESTKDAPAVVKSDTASEADVASSGLTLGDKPLSHSNYKISSEELVAQSIIFFVAGNETSARTLTFLTYCLTVNPDIQEKLRKEIFAVLDDKENVEYDDLAEMRYLDQCVNEALRLYPPVTRTERDTSEDWEHNGVKLEKGTIVAVPIFVIHREPEYWPNPEVYDPERFSPENKQKIRPYSFMSFGQGPRSCIGMRFAYYEIKIVMAHLLHKYRFVKCSQTQVPLILNDENGFLGTEKGVWVKVERL